MIFEEERFNSLKIPMAFVVFLRGDIVSGGTLQNNGPHAPGM
jgi:hypothetical protein